MNENEHHPRHRAQAGEMWDYVEPPDPYAVGYRFKVAPPPFSSGMGAALDGQTFVVDRVEDGVAHCIPIEDES